MSKATGAEPVKKPDGGPAFPTTKPLEHWGDPNAGMTLRDYFAAAVLPGLVLRHWADEKGNVPENVHELWARAAYRQADAMLAERDK